MPLIGITGGIVTGKSAVVRLLQAHGAVTFSADEAARAILNRDGPALQEIVQTFGREMLAPDGTLNRERLGKRIFADPEARNTLNRLTHPRIRRLLWDQICSVWDDFPPSVVLAVEIPLLFENGLAHWFERIVAVTASESVQIARMRARNGWDESAARQRLTAQWPLQKKMALADIVIPNEGSKEQLKEAVDALWNTLVTRGIGR